MTFDIFIVNEKHLASVLTAKLRKKMAGIPDKVKIGIGIQKTIKPK